MWTTIQVDLEKHESMKRKIEILKSIDNDKFCRFIEFIDSLTDSRTKANIKYWLNTFIQMELEKYRDLESNLELW